MKIGLNRKRNGNATYRVQVGDVGLYRWLCTIGLSERKSLTLGPLAVPDDHLLPLVRGLLDGDGSIVNKIWRADTKDRADYYWEWLLTQFTSGSRAHLEWLRNRLEAMLGLHGYLGTLHARGRRRPYYQLRYGKAASIVLLRALYAAPTAACLSRKRAIWDAYRERHGL